MISYTKLTAVTALLAGLIVSGCTGSPVITDITIECVSSSECEDGELCTTPLCEAGKCTYLSAPDGQVCELNSLDGICLSRTCRLDICGIPSPIGAFHPILSINPENSCEICDPARSTIHWSAVDCSAEATSQCDEGICDATQMGGTCQGRECCDVTSLWDGTGTAPSCDLGSTGTTGACNELGQCVGCSSPEECETGAQCLDWDCNSDMACVATTQATGLCDFSMPDASVITNGGVCVAGDCLRICLAPEDCPSGTYCNADRVCLNTLPSGSRCTDADQCSSGFCEPAAVPTSDATAYCAVRDCVECEGANALGSCVALTTPECGGYILSEVIADPVLVTLSGDVGTLHFDFSADPLPLTQVALFVGYIETGVIGFTIVRDASGVNFDLTQGSFVTGTPAVAGEYTASIESDGTAATVTMYNSFQGAMLHEGFAYTGVVVVGINDYFTPEEFTRAMTVTTE